MPIYSYSATSQQGEKKSGEIFAKDEKELTHVLGVQGLVLVFAKALKEKTPSRFSNFFSNLFGVSLTEKLIFIRNLRVMVASGVPLPRALEVLAEQTSSQKFKATIKDIKEKVLAGNMLSSVMGEYPRIFPDLFTNMVKVGEESGTLENVLSQLHIQLEKQHELRSRITGALMYPAVVVIAMLGIGVIMLITVVPQLEKTFKDMNVTLPVTTQFIIGMGHFFTNQWYIALGVFVLLGIGFLRAPHTKIGKKTLDALTLKLPILSGLVKKTNAATTLRTLSSLIASGVPIVRALEITSSVLGNLQYQDVLKKASEDVKRGGKLSDTLKPYTALYPPLVLQMVEVGEETGQSAEVFAKLAEFYEEEVAQVTQNLASVLEPVLMLIIGTVVGFFAISMLQPMYSLLGSVK